MLHSPILSGMRVLTESRALSCLDIYPNVDRASRLSCPVMVMHGARDEEVGHLSVSSSFGIQRDCEQRTTHPKQVSNLALSLLSTHILPCLHEHTRVCPRSSSSAPNPRALLWARPIRSLICAYVAVATNLQVPWEHGKGIYEAVPEAMRRRPWWVPDRGHNDICEGRRHLR